MSKAKPNLITHEKSKTKTSSNGSVCKVKVVMDIDAEHPFSDISDTEEFHNELLSSVRRVIKKYTKKV